MGKETHLALVSCLLICKAMPLLKKKMKRPGYKRNLHVRDYSPEQSIVPLLDTYLPFKEVEISKKEPVKQRTPFFFKVISEKFKAKYPPVRVV